MFTGSVLTHSHLNSRGAVSFCTLEYPEPKTKVAIPQKGALLLRFFSSHLRIAEAWSGFLGTSEGRILVGQKSTSRIGRMLPALKGFLGVSHF